jgi:hypothetical protein
MSAGSALAALRARVEAKRACQETASCCSRQRSRATVSQVWPAGQGLPHLGVAKRILARLPHIYFEWTEGNPAANLIRFLIFGVGEVAPVTREVIRRAEPDRDRRHVHVG